MNHNLRFIHIALPEGVALNIVDILKCARCSPLMQKKPKLARIVDEALDDYHERCQEEGIDPEQPPPVRVVPVAMVDPEVARLQRNYETVMNDPDYWPLVEKMTDAAMRGATIAELATMIAEEHPHAGKPLIGE